MLRSLLSGAAVLAALIAAPTVASAQSQTDLVDITDWTFLTGSTVPNVNSVLQSGYRMVDLEVVSGGLPILGGSFVRNTGAYGKGWWWYLDQTESQVTSRLSQHNARLIDVEPYATSNGTRYAIVLIPNTGQDLALSHGWETGMTFSQVSAWVNANPLRRITDIQPYTEGSSQRYCFTWVFNAGNMASSWWIYLNSTPQTISTALAQNNARLIDLEPHDGTGRMSAIMVPDDGNAWYWFYGVPSGSEANRIAEQYASRMIDFERYRDGGGNTRYAFILRRNDTDLNIETNVQMRSQLPIAASSGFLLKELGSSSVEHAGVMEEEIFEPASLMKTAHHFAACYRVTNNGLTFSSPILERTGLNGSCPTGTGVSIRPLRSVLRSMMEQSSNTATEAIREEIGTSQIEFTAGAFGALGVELNHTLGCLCGMPRNEISLHDLYELHDAVADGALLHVTDDFYELMQNENSFGMGAYSTNLVINEVLNASSLTSEERTSFLSYLEFAFKGGGYGCISSAGEEQHRSRGGYMRLPFRSGCIVEPREYFLGAWVNDATSAQTADDAAGVAIVTMFRERLTAAVESWEAGCNAFAAYCTAVPNSTGQVGRCEATGSPFVSTNSLTIRGEALPANQFGLLLYSTQTGFVPGVGGGEGNLCVGSPLVRFNSSIASSGASGSLSYALDLSSLPSGVGTRPVDPGETLYFQWWHRDVASTGLPTSNLTRGLRVFFL